MKYLLLGGFGLALAACGADNGAEEPTPEQTEEIQSESAAQTDQATVLTDQSKPGAIKDREFAEVSADEIKPAFEGGRVVKLNAIVRRSLNTANEYTGSIKSIRRVVDEAAAAPADAEIRTEAASEIDRVRQWHTSADEARTDMDAAVAELEESGESFSREILRGMVKYVTDVEEALEKEIATLETKLNA